MSNAELGLSIALGIGLAAATGFRLFLPLLVLSVAAWTGHVNLSESFAWLGTPTAVLMLGTLFAPTADRKGPGLGFAHEPGDIVRISSPALGTLTNRVQYSEDCPPWTFGLAALFQNLASRGITASPSRRGSRRSPTGRPSVAPSPRSIGTSSSREARVSSRA